MSYEELDKKYEPYTVEGYTGIEFWLDDIYNSRIEILLDSLIEFYPKFKIYQLKLKFDSVRFYTNLPNIIESICEEYIDNEYKAYKVRNEKRIEQESKKCD